jgi:hypothetical protein
MWLVACGLAMAAAVGAVARDAREARACSPPYDGISERRVFPEDGAVDVPTNARVLVEYATGANHGLDPPILRVQGGGEVEVEVLTEYTTYLDVRVLRPDAPLASSTTYEVLDTVSFDCVDVEWCIVAPAVVATFTTGTSTDTVAPTATGVTAPAVYVANQGTSCDKNSDAVRQEVAIAAFDDDRPVAWVRLEYLDAEGNVIFGPLPPIAVGRICGSGVANWDYDRATEAGDFAVRAIDLAGNVEAVAHELYAPTCEEALGGPALDAGGAGDDDGGDGGCCSSGGGAAGSLLMAALGLAATRRRRAR